MPTTYINYIPNSRTFAYSLPRQLISAEFYGPGLSTADLELVARFELCHRAIAKLVARFELCHRAIAKTDQTRIWTS